MGRERQTRVITMEPRSIGFAVLAALLWSAPAHAQKATEQFIPIGQSPGLSGEYTYLGAIEAADIVARSITAGGRSVQVTERTRIWLDRSGAKQPNLVGSFDDLRAGHRVEIKYEDEARRERADWIKVQADQDQ